MKKEKYDLKKFMTPCAYDTYSDDTLDALKPIIEAQILIVEDVINELDIALVKNKKTLETAFPMNFDMDSSNTYMSQRLAIREYIQSTSFRRTEYCELRDFYVLEQERLSAEISRRIERRQ
jgi:hypothetical protein